MPSLDSSLYTCLPRRPRKLLSGIAIGCGRVQAQGDAAAAEGPVPTRLVPDVDLTLFAVDHPEQFPFVTAEAHPSTSELVVTGAVTPDVSRNVPVVSLASDRILEDAARARGANKRGGGIVKVDIDESPVLSPQLDGSILALNDALEDFAKVAPRQAKVVELRWFAGMSERDVAELTGTSERTVRRDWEFGFLSEECN